mgnify:CR=1 FL=1
MEDGAKKGPTTIEKAKQGAYVAKSVSRLQKFRGIDGQLMGIYPKDDGGHEIQEYQLELDRIIDRIYTFLIRKSFKSFGKNSLISYKCRIDYPSNISVGSNVIICKNVWLNGGDRSLPNNTPTLTISDGCHISSYCHINAFHNVVIENDVLLAENVYLGDTNHQNSLKEMKNASDTKPAPIIFAIKRSLM